MFPPSDNDSIDNGENFNSQPDSRAMATGRSSGALIPMHGGDLTNMPWAYGLPSRPEILSATPNASNLLHALRRRVWLALFMGLALGGALGALAWFLLPTRYEAAATLVAHVANPSVWHDQGGVDFPTFKLNAAAMVKKNVLVLNKALSDKTVQEFPVVKKNSLDAANWLGESLTVEYPGNGELMVVSMRADEPDGVPEIVNAVVDAFIKEVVDKERTNKLVRRDTLDRKSRSYKTQVLEKQRQLFDLNQQIGTTDARAAHARWQMELDNLNMFMQRRTKLQNDIAEITFKIEKAKLLRDNADKMSVPEEQLEQIISQSPQIQDSMKDLSALRREQREVERTVRRKDDPAVQRIREAINSVEQNVQDLRNAARVQLIEQIKNNADSGGSTMKAMELERTLLAGELQTTIGNAEAQADNVQKLERFNGDADQLRTEIDQLNTVNKDLNATLTNWNIELEAGPRIEVQEKAGHAIAITPWRQIVVAGFAGFVGFCLALVGVTFFEFLSRRLNSASDVAEGLGIRVMGDLPCLRQRGLMRGRSRRAMHGLVAESINSIRATLIQNAEMGQSKVFLVTSANEQEGKTTVASQLAASLARAGRRTLLVDGDMRHPGAHHVFGLENDQGLSELLRGEVDVDDVLRPTPADGLWMITAGRCCGVSVMALGKHVMAQVMDQLRSRFEFIVVDTGPVLGVADPLLLGSHVDGAILSVLRDVSKIQKVYDAYERLKLAGVNVVGAVINGTHDHGSFDRYHMQVPAA